MVTPIQVLFPRLTATSYRVTRFSEPDRSYNCIAWVAGVTNQWWWPLGNPTETYWPDGVPRNRTVDAFHAAFAILGYTSCISDAPAGQQQAALAWIARLTSPNLRARALVGVAEGIAYRAGAKRPPLD